MVVPQSFLTRFVSQYSVTTSELEALTSALAGKPIAEIAEELGIQANAVRKRLGEVYQKFDLKGKGPGKLVKLQQLLIAAYQHETAQKKVVLVWSGEAGKRLAAGLAQTIFKHPRLEVILCRQDLAAVAWRNEVDRPLDNTSLSICCLSNLTTGIHLNLGYLWGRVGQIYLLQFQQSFPEILAAFPTIEAQKRSQLQTCLEQLIGLEEAQAWIAYQFSSWQNVLRTTAVLDHPVGDRNWLQITTAVEQAMAALGENKSVLENNCFQQIVLHSLAEINYQLDTRLSHSILSDLYPRYLFSLQKRLSVQISTLTIVEGDDNFWQEIGREIRAVAKSQRVRVFVFTTPDIFERNFKILLEQADQYPVRVVSYQKLSQDFPEYCQSFSLIAGAKAKLLAEFVIEDSIKYCRFSTVSELIAQHEKILTAIVDSAVEVNRANELSNAVAISQQMREIRDLVFERSRFAVKSVGISQYLSIENYQSCNTRQEFFPTLAEQMLAAYRQHRPQKRKSRRILELGAKTGDFTRYLAQLEADLWALELDWVCYKKLEYSLPALERKIIIEHKDSCAYDPPYQFNYIFSCLGDRHINLADKEKYLKNIKRNLERGGLLIVGDEFLPPYDYQNELERQQAIFAYHNHQLELAQADSGLITLISETLDCATANRGDYKLSCEQYERLLRKIGFTFTKQQINNSLYEQVGGVFIYQAWLEKAQ